MTILKFSYDIIENPNNIEEDENFYDFFGALVLDIARELSLTNY